MAASHLTGAHWVTASDLPTLAAAGIQFAVVQVTPGDTAGLTTLLNAASANGMKLIVGMWPYPYTWTGSTWTVSAGGQTTLAQLAAADQSLIHSVFLFNEPYQIPYTATQLKALPAVVRTYYPGAKLYMDMDQPDQYAPTYPDQTGIADFIGIWDYPFLQDGTTTTDQSRSRILQQHQFVKNSMGAQPVVLLQSLADTGTPPYFRMPTAAEMQAWVDAMASVLPTTTPLSWYVWDQASYADDLKNHASQLSATLSTKAPVSFPSTPVLDSFTRADNATLGANWQGDPIGLGWPDFAVATDAARSSSGWDSSAWNTKTTGADVEAYLTVATAGAPVYAELLARVSALSATFNGYSVRWDNTSMFIGRYDAGVFTQLGATVAQAVTDGTKIGLSLVGSTITLYVNTGSGWTAIATRTDATYDAAGYLAMVVDNGTVVFDDVGGGDIPTGGGGGSVPFSSIHIHIGLGI